MQIHLHEKFKNQMTSPGVLMLTEEGGEAHPGEKHGTPWRIVKAHSLPATSGKRGIYPALMWPSFDAGGGKKLRTAGDDNRYLGVTSPQLLRNIDCTNASWDVKPAQCLAEHHSPYMEMKQAGT